MHDEKAGEVRLPRKTATVIEAAGTVGRLMGATQGGYDFIEGATAEALDLRRRLGAGAGFGGFSVSMRKRDCDFFDTSAMPANAASRAKLQADADEWFYGCTVQQLRANELVDACARWHLARDGAGGWRGAAPGAIFDLNDLVGSTTVSLDAPRSSRGQSSQEPSPIEV